MPKSSDHSEFMAEARKRFVAAKAAWTTIRDDFRDDIRFVCGDPTKQWPDEIYASRRQEEIPALTFDRCNPRVQAIVNKSRRDRPQPKVGAGDTGDPEVADLIEGKVRHILYASQADIPFDNAVMYAASGGFGAYRVVMEYVGDSWIQEPRVKRIMDPMTCLYMDPASQEPDFCDAKYWFIRVPIKRDEFKARFHVEPKPFDTENENQWGDEEETVWIAEYWCVESGEGRYVQLHSGESGYFDEFEGIKEEHIANERQKPRNKVCCYLIDGEKVMETTEWIGSTIPIYVVTGKEVVQDGKRRFISAIRYTKDPQQFLNATTSEVAISFGVANMNGFIGPEGFAKDPKWRSNKRELYREYKPVIEPQTGQLLPPPARDNWAPPIQHLVQGISIAADAIQGSMGYTDRVTRPSQAEISGVAVERREEQTDAANTQYEDNLVASQWRLGKDLAELIIKSTDTPRLMTSRSEDGTERKVPIAVPDETGAPQLVPGHENKTHYRLDMGNYDVSISVGPGYATKTEEESDFIAQILQALGPEVGILFLDLIFKKKGYSDLQKRAELAVPQIQQALQAANPEQEMSPQQMKAQLAQAAQQNQQLKAGLMQLMQILKGKQVEAQGRLDVEKTRQAGEVQRQKLALAGDLMKMQHEHSHEHAGMMHEGRMDAIELITNLLHESAMTQQGQQHEQNMAAMQPPPGQQQGAVQ